MNLHDYVISSLPKTVIYIPNFITTQEESEILNKVYSVPKPKWTQLKNRRLQNWGGIPHIKGMIPEKIPEWLQKYLNKINSLDIFEKNHLPNHVFVNEYTAGQGIMPHVDGPLFYPIITTVNCGSHTLLNFQPNYIEDILPEPSELIFLGAIFVVTFISTILPLQLVSNLRNVIDPEKRSLYKRIVSILNCFAGGVFLGTALLDLFPHVMSNIKEALPNSTFPFPEFIIGFGFLIILTTEQIIIDCKERTSDCRNPIERLQTRNIQLERETLTVNTQDEAIQKTSPDLLPKEENRSLQLKFHSILLLAALSLHSLFEGLTLGLIQSPAFVLQLFLAILIHKIPVAFSLGLHLVQSELKISAVIHFDLWFSLMTPIGTGIGILLKIMTPNVQTNLINGIAIGLATGTFIFVVFVEILPKELKLGRSRLPNLLFFILGFSFICATILFKRKY